MEKSSVVDAHSFAARNFAHLYAVGGRQHMRMWLRCNDNHNAYIWMRKIFRRIYETEKR